MPDPISSSTSSVANDHYDYEHGVCTDAPRNFVTPNEGVKDPGTEQLVKEQDAKKAPKDCSVQHMRSATVCGSVLGRMLEAPTTPLGAAVSGLVAGLSCGAEVIQSAQCELDKKR